MMMRENPYEFAEEESESQPKTPKDKGEKTEPALEVAQ